MSDTMTYLTDATMITAVVPAGRADDLLKAARDVGASGGIVHQARGTGARELLGLLGIVVEAEREVVNIVVPADYQELVTNAIFHAGGLGKPGGGYLYLTALEKVATYIPEASMARLRAGN
jgi:nitrogen regulatory protein P-II 1